VAPPEIIKEKVPAALVADPPAGWHGTIRTTADWIDRGDRNAAALRVCRAQVTGIRQWNEGPASAVAP
jgi:hypothetical protein